MFGSGNDPFGNNPFGAWTQMWMDAAAQAMQACLPAGATAQSPDAIRDLRAKWMQTWSDWCEQSMRSPAFLEAQKQMLDGNLAVRKQFRAAMRRMQREMQLAGQEDVDALMAAIRRNERRMADQLDELSERLRAMEAKIDRLAERSGRSHGEDDSSANGSPQRARVTESE